MTQVMETDHNSSEVKVQYSNSTTELGVPLSGDLASLLALQEVKEIKVHGKPLLLNANQIDNYLASEDIAVADEIELGQLLEKQISKDDVEKIYNQQLHRKLVGQQFNITELGNFESVATEELKLIIPDVKVAVSIVEEAIESIENDDLSKYKVFLPPTTKEEELNPVHCITGNVLRIFLNGMQDDDSGLDMNAQILVYAKLLTSLNDEDPTKKFALTQLRMLMQFGDVVSNKSLRIALTHMLEEGSELSD